MAFSNDAEFQDEFRKVGDDVTAGFEAPGSPANPTEGASSESLYAAAAEPDEDDDLEEDDEEDEDDDDLEDDDLEDDDLDDEDEDEDDLEDEDDDLDEDEDDEDDDEDEEDADDAVMARNEAAAAEAHSRLRA